MNKRWFQGIVVLGVTAGTLIWSLLNRRALLPTAGLLLISSHTARPQGPTVIHVSDVVARDHVKRFGMNLGGEAFYDSFQILRNLVSRNPGFEGQDWQSVLQCAHVTANSCSTADTSSPWPDGFLDGASYEILSGSAEGSAGKITHSIAANKGSQVGVTLQFSSAVAGLAEKTFIVVRKRDVSNAIGGWWPQVQGGASIAGETGDIAPESKGQRAVQLTALLPGQSASINEYFDSTAGQSFVQLHGGYTLRFRAKGIGGNKRLAVQFSRLVWGSRNVFLSKDVTLGSTWSDYSLPFRTDETSPAVGTLSLSFGVSASDMLLDDVSLTSDNANGTVFRDEVVATLRSLNPGILRFMDGENFGSSFENMIAVEGARRRSGFSVYSTETQDVPIGLNDFLVLCEVLGAEPWYTMQMGMTPEEGANLLEFLGGSVKTKYGSKRAALGHPEPWTKTFSTIHLEFGNESWNTVQRGAIIPDPIAYAHRATTVFHAMRASPAFSAGHYDLVANGFAVSTYWNQKVLETADGYDSIDIAPYLFANFQDASSTENIFGPMFAQPEMMDTAPKGIVRQQAEIAAHAARPAALEVYETNFHTTQGSVDQAALNTSIPSVAGGLGAIEHMLLMLRDDGIIVQNTFNLTGSNTRFRNTTTPTASEVSPVWGSVVDMGGRTNRVRPIFLAQLLANQAIRPTMLKASITGEDPTWSQKLSLNDKIQLEDAHELQTFAFGDQHSDVLIVFNLSRTSSHDVSVDGPRSPQGAVEIKTLTAEQITATNETDQQVQIATRQEKGVQRGKRSFRLPPFSMTVFTAPR